MDAPGTRTVYIDGYNILLRHAPWRGLPLHAGRDRLRAFLEGLRWPVPVGRIVLVFDGRDAADGPPRRAGKVEIQFAPSADAALQEALRTHPHPDRLLIVTDDREILRTARSHGAHCHASQWLLALGRRRTPASGAGDARPDLPAGEARRITDELAKRWLKPPG